MTVDERISWYKRGVSFEKIRTEDLVYPSYKLFDMASDYNVKYEDFDTSKEEVSEYINKLENIKYDFFDLMKNMENNYITRFCLFHLLVGGALCLQFCYVTNYFGGIMLILSLTISFTILFPQFNIWCKGIITDHFFSKKGIVRNKNVEDFCNEVMFQAYIRERNPKLERKNQKH